VQQLGAAVKLLLREQRRNFRRAASVESCGGSDMATMLDRKAQINMTPMIDILLVLPARQPAWNSHCPRGIS
jgi:hypothetical protein